MNNTMKLCNFRDCINDKHESCPHNAIDPCKVFRAETGHWYYEETGSPITKFRMKDGKLFNVQLWLEEQIQIAATSWNNKSIVHETYRGNEIKHRPPTHAARAPKYSNEELDIMGDAFIRNSSERADLRDRMKESGLELHGLKRMYKKWGTHPIVKQRITEIEEEREAMKVIQSEMDKGNHSAKRHIKSENTWTNKWRQKSGNWQDFVLMYEKDNILYVIDRHGLKADGQYLFLPDEDNKFFESALIAEQRYGIIHNAWDKMYIPQEKIGNALRKQGKKNANGARIAARYEQTKYVGTVQNVIKALRNMHVSVLSIRYDEELYEYYIKNIAPKISHR